MGYKRRVNEDVAQETAANPRGRGPGKRNQWRPRELTVEERKQVGKLVTYLDNLLGVRRDRARDVGGWQPPAKYEELDTEGLRGVEHFEKLVPWLELNAIDHALLRLRPHLSAELDFLWRLHKGITASPQVPLVTALLRHYATRERKWRDCDEALIERAAASCGLSPEKLQKAVEDEDVQNVLFGYGSAQSHEQGPSSAAKVLLANLTNHSAGSLDNWMKLARTIAFFDLD